LVIIQGRQTEIFFFYGATNGLVGVRVRKVHSIFSKARRSYAKVGCNGRLQRPNDGQVADNGSFAFCDWLFTDKLAGAFYAFDCSGQILIKKKFRANLCSASISQDGAYAACQTASNPASRYIYFLSFFDLRSRA
jgi:hypothetical protein